MRSAGRATPAVLDHADQVVARIDDERRMSHLRRAVDRLPAHERATLELVAWSGLSVADAAAVLHVAEGAVNSRLARGRGRLADLLGPSSSEEN